MDKQYVLDQIVNGDGTINMVEWCELMAEAVQDEIDITISPLRIMGKCVIPHSGEFRDGAGVAVRAVNVFGFYAEMMAALGKRLGYPEHSNVGDYWVHEAGDGIKAVAHTLSSLALDEVMEANEIMKKSGPGMAESLLSNREGEELDQTHVRLHHRAIGLRTVK